MPVDSNGVSKVVLKNEESKILVLTRSDNSMFDLPGGHIHVGEPHMMGAIREVYEETKLVLLELKEIMKYRTKILFLSENFDGLMELDTSENSDYKWMTEDEFLSIEQNNSTDVITAYQAYIRNTRRHWK